MKKHSYYFSNFLFEEDLKTPQASNFLLKLSSHFEAIYLSVVRLVGNLSDVDDILQDACLKMWTSFDTLEDENRFRSWAIRIATNTAIDFLRERRNKTGIGLSDNVLNTIINCQKASEEYFELRLEVLTECIRELSYEQQDLIIDVYTHGKSISTLAEKYCKPLRTLQFHVKKNP